MDRASAFVDQETLDLIRDKYVPVGISLQEDLKSQDPAGQFFRKPAFTQHNQQKTMTGYRQGYEGGECESAGHG